jgi:hypothetical protein
VADFKAETRKIQMNSEHLTVQERKQKTKQKKKDEGMSKRHRSQHAEAPTGQIWRI